jgi:hypothetical protein
MPKYRWPLVGLVCAVVMCLAAQDLYAQSSRRTRRDAVESSWTDGFQAPRRLIDCPTAGTLRRGSFDTELRAFPEGGMLGILQIGLTNAWTVGIGYGGTDIIAANSPRWNPHLQFTTKFQILAETMSLPGIAVGYEDIGFGRWIDSLDRFETKSRGFYAVGSKGFQGAGFTSSLHAGLNYSRETDDNDEDLNFFFGTDIRFENNLGLVAEYDMALNDDKKPLAQGDGYGYLNAGVRWVVLDRILMEFNLKDLTSNRRHTSTIGRELRLIYVESF